MRIEQLECIAAVTRFGSLRRAAEELHLSQPALSETVRNLERELGVDLLERKRSGAKISDEGRELLPHITNVLDTVDRLRGSAGDQHRISSTDGAEMGKLMVAEGLGATVLPDFSVVGDPLERRGAITVRPLAGDGTEVLLVVQRRHSGSVPRAVRDLHELFVRNARAYQVSCCTSPNGCPSLLVNQTL
ncbi:LysR family transcriptional regulator [Streptomyces sp. HC44]|uniref:LysR family transcriptional regulator n=1 Tax=Streptomyces scabichelini TaxID=2711217 RepID=A0A6G4UXY8_9ACTN|nr:LysR family transcriptional regulator [Streptomyces scabichelini]